jgi:hypothetical protein
VLPLISKLPVKAVLPVILNAKPVLPVTSNVPEIAAEPVNGKPCNPVNNDPLP